MTHGIEFDSISYEHRSNFFSIFNRVSPVMEKMKIIFPKSCSDSRQTCVLQIYIKKMDSNSRQNLFQLFLTSFILPVYRECNITKIQMPYPAKSAPGVRENIPRSEGTTGIRALDVMEFSFDKLENVFLFQLIRY